jgi:hypothetical protein
MAKRIMALGESIRHGSISQCFLFIHDFAPGPTTVEVRNKFKKERCGLNRDDDDDSQVDFSVPDAAVRTGMQHVS